MNVESQMIECRRLIIYSVVYKVKILYMPKMLRANRSNETSNQEIFPFVSTFKICVRLGKQTETNKQTHDEKLKNCYRRRFFCFPMPVYFLLLLIFVESVLAFCPVTNSLSSGFYNYPVDLFDLEQVNKSHINGSFDCFAYDAENKYPKNMTKHICSHTKLCPINRNEIEKTLEGTKLKRNISSLCKVTEVILKNISKLNIMVFGGSVPLGTFAAGCKTKDSCIINQIEESLPKLRACPTCAWPNYLNMMIQKVFGKKVKDVVNLARSGRSSYRMSEQILNSFQENNINKLSGNDVIFIDHSTNDNTFITPVRNKQLAIGLESLIRKIYTFSDPKSLPTIILLATEYVPRHLIKHPSFYYTNVYSIIADHYHIPLWNLDDLYHSHLLNTNLTFTKYITRQYNWDDKHPSWMVHLYTADLIGAIMLKELEECSKMSVVDRLQLINKHYINEFSELPPVLYKHNESAQCGSDTIVSMSYDSLVVSNDKFSSNMINKDNISRDKTLNQVNGSWESKPLNAWQLKLDINGHAGGFIHEFYNNTINQKTINQNDTVDNSAELIFTLPLKTIDFNSGTFNILLKLTILRTYENAGYVQVLFCNHPVIFDGLQTPVIGGLDALWGDFESYRYSLPETFTAMLNACPVKNDENVTLVLNHTRRTDFVTARQQQKVKLIHIEVCFANK